jgi:hypothetical protein
LACLPNVEALYYDSSLILDHLGPATSVAALVRQHPDARLAWAECQGLCLVGYVADGSVDPPIVIHHDIGDHDEESSTDVSLSRFLLRALIDEALFHSPVCASTSAAEPDRIDHALEGFTEIVGAISRWPPVLTDGRLLVVAYRQQTYGIPGARVQVAAQRRSDIVDSAIGQLPRLHWQYEDPSRPTRGRPLGMAPELWNSFASVAHVVRARLDQG